MIDVSDIVNDLDFAQSFTINRSSGLFVLGVWTNTNTVLTSYGAMQPATSRDIDMVPEADRVTEMVAVWSSQPLYTTGTTGGSDVNAHISDIVVWHGDKYRVLTVKNWFDDGYYKAVATRMAGA